MVLFKPNSKTIEVSYVMHNCLILDTKAFQINLTYNAKCLGIGGSEIKGPNLIFSNSKFNTIGDPRGCTIDFEHKRRSPNWPQMKCV